MIAKTFTEQIQRAGAYEAGLAAHCRRVAAWCEELARKQKLPRQDTVALTEAALMHHRPELLTGEPFTRLMADLGVSGGAALSHEPSISPLAEDVLSLHRDRRARGHSDRTLRLARLLEAANCFDEQLEYAPFEQDGIDKVLTQAVEEQVQTEEAVAFVIQSLRRAGRDDLAAVMPKLPVYPAVAMRLYRLLSNEEVSLAALESVARADQVIAGKLVKAANSVYYSPMQQIKSVTQAIGYVGMDDARRILLASSLQPLFAAPRLRKLWKHALEAAQIAEKIAALSGKVDASEAFLLGLLHDVGKLAMSLLSRDLNEAIERLLEKGCQPATAELVLCGFDHAEAGAEVMRFWRFADPMIAAVQHHHQPERTDSKMAAILYLTEYWTDSEEDLPSNARLYTAMQMVSLTPEALDSARVGFNDALANL